MQEDKGLQELAEQILLDEGKRSIRMITRGEPTSYQFTPEFLFRFKKEYERLKEHGIGMEKILRGLEFQVLQAEERHKVFQDTVGYKYGPKMVDVQPIPPRDLKHMPTVKV